MAKMICRCEMILRDDDPDCSLFLLSDREFDVDKDSAHLFGLAKLVLHCPACGRLWVFWEEGKAPAEYVLGSEVPHPLSR